MIDVTLRILWCPLTRVDFSHTVTNPSAQRDLSAGSNCQVFDRRADHGPSRKLDETTTYGVVRTRQNHFP